jgi:hypothetical protein
VTVRYNGQPIVGFGEAPTPPTTTKTSPWPMVLASSVVSAAAGWAIDEVVRKVRKKRR